MRVGEHSAPRRELRAADCAKCTAWAARRAGEEDLGGTPEEAEVDEECEAVGGDSSEVVDEKDDVRESVISVEGEDGIDVVELLV